MRRSAKFIKRGKPFQAEAICIVKSGRVDKSNIHAYAISGRSISGVSSVSDIDKLRYPTIYQRLSVRTERKGPAQSLTAEALELEMANIDGSNYFEAFLRPNYANLMWYVRKGSVV